MLDLIKAANRHRFALLVGVALFALLALTTEKVWSLIPICITDQCKEGREWLSYFATIAIVLGGIGQYKKTQAWKRAEWLAAETEAFLSDKKVMNALYMLDWDSRPLPLQPDDPPSPDNRFSYTTAHLRTALVSRSTARKDLESGKSIERPFTKEEVAIRDAFDLLLGRLGRFEAFIDAGLITFEELKPYLVYWMELIGNEKLRRKPTDVIYTLWAYINDYDFVGAKKLAARFGFDLVVPEGKEVSRGPIRT